VPSTADVDFRHHLPAHRRGLAGPGRQSPMSDPRTDKCRQADRAHAWLHLSQPIRQCRRTWLSHSCRRWPCVGRSRGSPGGSQTVDHQLPAGSGYRNSPVTGHVRQSAADQPRRPCTSVGRTWCVLGRWRWSESRAGDADHRVRQACPQCGQLGSTVTGWQYRWVMSPASAALSMDRPNSAVRQIVSATRFGAGRAVTVG
jgi:hypothetical protein